MWHSSCSNTIIYYPKEKKVMYISVLNSKTLETSGQYDPKFKTHFTVFG